MEVEAVEAGGSAEASGLVCSGDSVVATSASVGDAMWPPPATIITSISSLCSTTAERPRHARRVRALWVAKKSCEPKICNFETATIAIQ